MNEEKDRLLNEAVALLALTKSASTTSSYSDWIYRFIRFQGKKTVRAWTSKDIADFIKFLSLECGLSTSSCNQALYALRFFYATIVGKRPAHCQAFTAVSDSAKGRLSFLSHADWQKLEAELNGMVHTIACLMYGSGLRLQECTHLLEEDVDFDRSYIHIRPNGQYSGRHTVLPNRLIDPLRSLITHNSILRRSHGDKISPSAACPNYLFFRLDPNCSRQGPKPFSSIKVRKAIADGMRKAGLPDQLTCNSLRQGFMYRLLERGLDAQLITRLMGYKTAQSVLQHKKRLEAQITLYLESPLDKA